MKILMSIFLALLMLCGWVMADWHYVLSNGTNLTTRYPGSTNDLGITPVQGNYGTGDLSKAVADITYAPISVTIPAASNAALAGVAASYLPLVGGATTPMAGALYMGSNELVNIFNSCHYSAEYSVDDGRYEDDGGRIKWGNGEVYIRGGTVGPWMEMAFGLYGQDCFKFVANPTWYLDMLTYPITNAGVISATAFTENGTSLSAKYAPKTDLGTTFPAHAAGLLYYHSTSNKLFCSDGSVWNALW